MIANVLLIFSLSGVALGSIACCILLFWNNTNKYANRLLGLALFGMVNIMLVTFLFQWNPDLYAYIYRFPSPLLYCIFPAIYLYIKAVHTKGGLRKKDLFHFLPSFFYLIEMLPHYFTTYEYRLSIIRTLKENPINLVTLNDGALPEYYHIAFLCIQAACYLIVTFTLLVKVRALKHENFIENKSIFYHGSKKFFSAGGFIIFSTIFTLIICRAFLHNDVQALLISCTVSILFVNLYLFFHPEILYGISRKKTDLLFSPLPNAYVQVQELETKGTTEEKQFPVQQVIRQSAQFSNLENYKPVLESYMNSKAPFLKQGYSIYHLSRETGIPQHHLSALLNRIYKMRFTDYINEMRISYIRKHFNNGEWEKLTLEGMAKHAGFKSRTTFFNAIKKTSGTNPSAFLAELKKQSISNSTLTDESNPV
jgi:AraC-like DNA-binding protein